MLRVSPYWPRAYDYLIGATFAFAASDKSQFWNHGFNDIFATRYMTPPLTTVGYDASQIGALGSQLVLQEINASDNGRKPTVLTVKPKLNVRGSTGPAPQREGSPMA